MKMPSGRRANSRSLRQLARIVATFGEDIEGAQLNLIVVLAGMQRVLAWGDEAVTGTSVCLWRYLSIHEPKSEYCDAPTRQATNGYACAQA